MKDVDCSGIDRFNLCHVYACAGTVSQTLKPATYVVSGIRMRRYHIANSRACTLRCVRYTHAPVPYGKLSSLQLTLCQVYIRMRRYRIANSRACNLRCVRYKHAPVPYSVSTQSFYIWEPWGSRCHFTSREYILHREPQGSQKIQLSLRVLRKAKLTLRFSEKSPTKPKGSQKSPTKPKGSQKSPTKPNGSQKSPTKPKGSQKSPTKPKGSQRSPTKPKGSQKSPSKIKGSLSIWKKL